MGNSILQGCTPCCGPSQAGPDPLKAPVQIDDAKSLLVQRVGPPKPAPAKEETRDAASAAVEMIKSGLPFAAVFRLDSANLHMVFNGIDALEMIEIAVKAIRQDLLKAKS